MPAATRYGWSHDSELAKKVYERAGFAVTGTGRPGRIEMERRRWWQPTPPARCCSR